MIDFDKAGEEIASFIAGELERLQIALDLANAENSRLIAYIADLEAQTLLYAEERDNITLKAMVEEAYKEALVKEYGDCPEIDKYWQQSSVRKRLMEEK